MVLENILMCPECQGEICRQDGSLQCQACKKEYGSKEGIPVLIDLNNLPAHLSSQIQYFEAEPVSDTEYALESWHKTYLRRFFDNFGDDLKGKVVVDCGTGSGYMAVELAKKGAYVIACDLTMKSLVRLQGVVKGEGLEDNLLLVCCGAEDLPFKSDRVDFFISNAVLEHLPREKRAIEEINRVCKGGSGIMITVPLSYAFLHPFLLPVNYIHDKRIGHLRRYDEDILREKFSFASLVKTYYTGHTEKVLKVLVNMIFPLFDKEKIEERDAKKDTDRHWASNIICFLRKDI